MRYKCGLATAGSVRIEGHEWRRAWLIDVSFTASVYCSADPWSRAWKLWSTHGEGQKNLEILARVCHTTREPSGEWMTGCEFATP